MPRAAPVRPDPLAKLCESVAFLAAAVLVLAVPLVWNTHALDPFRGPKSELALATWATLAALFVASNWRGPVWHDSWWALWGGVLAGGALSAVASGHAVPVLGSLLPLMLAALGWGSLRQLSDSRRGRLAKFVLWAAVIQAAVVLAFLNPLWQPTSFANLNLESGRYAFIGTLGNPADVAVFLVLPALLAVERAATVRRTRLVYAAMALLLVGIIVATRTLTAIAALTAGLTALAWLTVERRYLVRVFASGAALLVLVVVATPLRGRVTQALRDMRVAGGIWIGSGRAAGSIAAVNMLAARPLTGIGFDQFEANSFRFQSLTALAERGKVLGLRTGFGEAHDDLIQYAAETGLAGIALVAAGFAYAWRRRQRGGGTINLQAPLVVAALVVAATQFPLHLAATAAQWAALGAVLLPPLPPPPEPTHRAARVRLAATLCVMAAAGFIAWQRFDASVAMGQARLLASTLRSSSASLATRTQIARTALGHLLPRAGWLPGSWQARLVVGNLAAEAGDTRLELESFASALSMVERPEVQFDVGMALLRSGQREEGLAHVVRAVELNPAIFREVKDAELSQALRRRLDATGYGAKQAWMYEGTPAANP